MSKKGISQLFDVSNKVILITGGAGAIGSSIAKGFAKLGAKLIFTDFNLPEAQNIAHKMKIPATQIIVEHLDVRDQTQVQNVVKKSISHFNRIDILFNNAGINPRIKAVDIKKEIWEEVININLSGMFFMAQEVAKQTMIPNLDGKIINTSSLQGMKGAKGAAAYASSKGGIITLTKVLANEWGKFNINVNSIAPSNLDTPMTARVYSEKGSKEKASKKTPLQRLGIPDDLIGTVLYLSSPASNYVTGQTIIIDGGKSVS
tara:strand:+ start:13067 stop:13846 length:780 start_codon:yes stop_codon:yes gene_type:complete